jgi:hypothetical protein
MIISQDYKLKADTFLYSWISAQHFKNTCLCSSVTLNGYMGVYYKILSGVLYFWNFFLIKCQVEKYYPKWGLQSLTHV